MPANSEADSRGAHREIVEEAMLRIIMYPLSGPVTPYGNTHYAPHRPISSQATGFHPD